jgi:hypothetical protein
MTTRRKRTGGLVIEEDKFVGFLKCFTQCVTYTTQDTLKSPNTRRNNAEIYTYINQSTDHIRAMSSVGRPTACKTINMVTRPADGIPAAPMAAAVAVRL